MPKVEIEKFEERRIRDPVHGLIVFDGKNEIDRFAWALIKTSEFQRLRRIKQLGFSDFVYPGASHTRFAHSIGAFHVAKRLLRSVHRHLAKRDPARVVATSLAALLHDVGHGPFSHAFEHVTRAVGQSGDHEDWTVQIVTGDTQIRRVLDQLDPKLPDAIATLIKSEEAADIYATVVSSQFDADRLDYLQRDRIMTGVQIGHIDADWLFDCLRVGKVTIGEGRDAQTEACLFLNHKGIRVAEEYLEARFRLYTTVYMHKTTRAAEKMLEAAMPRIADLARRKKTESQLGNFLKRKNPALSEYLALDDMVVWSEISSHRGSKDRALAELCQRLLDRRLFKCFDVGPRLDQAGWHEQLIRFRDGVLKRLPHQKNSAPAFLEDDAKVTGYKWYDAQDPHALKKIFVQRKKDDDIPVDIAAEGVSPIVKTLLSAQERIHRFYVGSSADVVKLEKIWEGIGR